MTRTNVTIANGVLNEDNRIQRWNMIPYSFVKWAKIVKVYPVIKEVTILPETMYGDQYTAMFYSLIFDYERIYDNRSVVKISEQIKTSAFQIDISWN